MNPLNDLEVNEEWLGEERDEEMGEGGESLDSFLIIWDRMLTDEQFYSL